MKTPKLNSEWKGVEKVFQVHTTSWHVDFHRGTFLQLKIGFRCWKNRGTLGFHRGTI